MTLLCIETSTKVCSAAITVDGCALVSRISKESGNHAQLLPCFVEELLAECRAQGLTLDGVALSEGPGSYTGLRIGASLAKGLCYGLNIPLLPLPTTQVLAASFISHQTPDTKHQTPNTLLCPMIDARRMEVYTALYTPELEQKGQVEAKIVDNDSWKEELKEKDIYFFGDGAMKCAQAIVSEKAHFVADIVPEAQYMGRVAEALPKEAYVEGKALAYFDPLYVKEFVPAPSHVKGLSTLFIILLTTLMCACSTTKNTPATRSYHQMKVRYNILYNGNNAYLDGLQAINTANEDDFSKVISLYPVSNHDAAQAAASQMDVTIEKCRKCIKLHSIKARPKVDPKRRNDPKYKLWLESEEFNNMMDEAWLRLGQAEFHKGDFLGSIGTFTYILNHYKNDPDIQACCQLWIARAYAEMGWYYEAEDMLRRVNVDDLSRQHASIYSAHMADYLLKTEQYHAAIPYVKIALPEEKRKVYRPRFQYVLAQLYELEENTTAAAANYKKVIKMMPPVEMDVNARIHMAEQEGLSGVRPLLKMAKLEKNKDRLDVIYGAVGTIYLHAKDTAKALEYLDLAIEKSTQAGLAKAQVLVTAGDLYFLHRNYTKAQPCYNEAVTILTPEDDDYTRLSRRAEVLDALIQEVNTVTLQDSLQRLSKMTEEEQMAVCEKIVADLLDAEKKAEEAAALAAREAQQEGPLSVNTRNMLGGVGASADWYFYNASLLRSGKQEFSRRWNNRPLEDNWRRMSKTEVSSSFDTDITDNSDLDTTNQTLDTTNQTLDTKHQTSTASDPHDPLYYFQQIPKTQEDLAASDTLLARALYNMVEIYAIKLGDMPLAQETLAQLNSRFPDYPTPQMEVQQLSAEQVAAMLADRRTQDSLYEQTYYAFKKGQFKTVKRNKQYAEEHYPESDLMPRYLFLNAVAVARSEGQAGFIAALEEMVERYPSFELSAKAKDMLAMMNQGMTAKKGGAVSSLEGKREQSTTTLETEPTTKQWSDKVDVASYVVITLPTEDETILNKMLYETALFNFSQFLIRDFDIQTLPTYAGGCALRISVFETLKEADWYIDLVHKNEQFMKAIVVQGAKLISVTEENYSLLEDRLMDSNH